MYALFIIYTTCRHGEDTTAQYINLRAKIKNKDKEQRSLTRELIATDNNYIVLLK